MVRTAVQLHTLRTLPEGMERKLDRIANAGYEGVQFTPDMGDIGVDALRDALAARNLEPAGCHIDREAFQQDSNRPVERYRTLGVEDLVISVLPRKCFETRAAVAKAVDSVVPFGDTLAESGFALHYHNHSFEFEPLGDETAYDRFVADTAGNLRLEIDTGLAYRAGVDPAGLIERYASRIDLVHLTDTVPGSDATAHVDLGEGDVDLRSCVAASVDAEVEWLIYENGRTDDPGRSIAAAAEVMTELLAVTR